MEEVMLGLVEHRRDLKRASIVVTPVKWLRMCSRSNWAKTMRMIEEPMPWPPFGTTDSAMRMKWTRHRCQAKPWNTVPTASQPECALEMISFTPSNPRTLSDRRNEG